MTDQNPQPSIDTRTYVKLVWEVGQALNGDEKHDIALDSSIVDLLERHNIPLDSIEKLDDPEIEKATVFGDLEVDELDPKARAYFDVSKTRHKHAVRMRDAMALAIRDLQASLEDPTSFHQTRAHKEAKFASRPLPRYIQDSTALPLDARVGSTLAPPDRDAVKLYHRIMDLGEKGSALRELIEILPKSDAVAWLTPHRFERLYDQWRLLFANTQAYEGMDLNKDTHNIRAPPGGHGQRYEFSLYEVLKRCAGGDNALHRIVKQFERNSNIRAQTPLLRNLPLARRSNSTLEDCLDAAVNIRLHGTKKGDYPAQADELYATIKEHPILREFYDELTVDAPGPLNTKSATEILKKSKPLSMPSRIPEVFTENILPFGAMIGAYYLSKELIPENWLSLMEYGTAVASSIIAGLSTHAIAAMANARIPRRNPDTVLQPFKKGNEGSKNPEEVFDAFDDLADVMEKYNEGMRGDLSSLQQVTGALEGRQGLAQVNPYQGFEALNDICNDHAGTWPWNLVYKSTNSLSDKLAEQVARLQSIPKGKGTFTDRLLKTIYHGKTWLNKAKAVFKDHDIEAAFKPTSSGLELITLTDDNGNHIAPNIPAGTIQGVGLAYVVPVVIVNILDAFHPDTDMRKRELIPNTIHDIFHPWDGIEHMLHYATFKPHPYQDLRAKEKELKEFLGDPARYVNANELLQRDLNRSNDNLSLSGKIRQKFRSSDHAPAYISRVLRDLELNPVDPAARRNAAEVFFGLGDYVAAENLGYHGWKLAQNDEVMEYYNNKGVSLRTLKEIADDCLSIREKAKRALSEK